MENMPVPRGSDSGHSGCFRIGAQLQLCGWQAIVCGAHLPERLMAAFLSRSEVAGMARREHPERLAQDRIPPEAKDKAKNKDSLRSRHPGGSPWIPHTQPDRKLWPWRNNGTTGSGIKVPYNSLYTPQVCSLRHSRYTTKVSHKSSNRHTTLKKCTWKIYSHT